MFSDKVAQYIAVTMIGGAVSEAAGGDFLEGAVAAAMVHLFNDGAGRQNNQTNVYKKLTFTEARNHFIYGNGQPVYVEASSIDLSNVGVSDFKNVGDSKVIQLFFHGAEFSSVNDALVYGSITLIYAGNNNVAIKPDYYNFEMHDWSSLGEGVRNIATLIAIPVHYDYIPNGSSSFQNPTPYTINFIGTAKIGGQ